MRKFGLFSLLKIIRVLRFTKVISFINTTESVKQSLRIFKLLFYLLMYVHWQACAWFFYTRQDKMWFPIPDLIMDHRTFYEHGITYTYCMSIYHSVGILDGVEMVPANAHQAIVVSFLVLVSEFIHAHIIGTIDVVLHNLSARSSLFFEQIEFASATMKNIRMSSEVQQKVLSYLSKVHNKMDQRKDLDHLMSKLSPSLKILVTKHLFLNVI